MEAYTLHLAGVLLTFILKVTAGFVLCAALATLLPNPRHRFLTWLGFILASAVSWITALADETVSFLSRATAESASAVTPIAGGEHFTISTRWGIAAEWFMLAVGAVYLAGVAGFLVVKAYKHLRLRAWLRHGRRPSPQLQAMFRELCQEFNIRRCKLRVLPEVSSPATVYWWTPRVIVPEICEELAATPQLRNVLRHELIHTLRCDYLWAWLCDVICGMLFFHPAVWIARRQLSMQRELACDLGVVETHPENRLDYADSLARFVRLLMLQQRPSSAGIDFAGAPSLLGTRIRYILAEPPKPPRWKRVIADTAFVASIIAFVGISPALSISIDFTPERDQSTLSARTAAPAPHTTIARSRVTSLHSVRRSVSQPVQYPDNLTTLPLRNTVETAENIIASDSSLTGQYGPSGFRNSAGLGYQLPEPRVAIGEMDRVPSGHEHHTRTHARR